MSWPSPTAPATPAVTLYIWDVPIDLNISDVYLRLHCFRGLKRIEFSAAGAATAANSYIRPQLTTADTKATTKDVVVHFETEADWLAPYQSIMWLRDQPFRMQFHRDGTQSERDAARSWRSTAAGRLVKGQQQMSAISRSYVK